MCAAVLCNDLREPAGFFGSRTRQSGCELAIPPHWPESTDPDRSFEARARTTKRPPKSVNEFKF